MTTVEKIRRLIREDKIIPVVGAGVSYATANLPGWAGLIQDGLQYADDKQLDANNIIEKGRNLLEQGKLTEAATIVKNLLNAHDHPFSDWLNDRLGKPTVRSTELIESIQNLCLPIIATTNYDDLLNEVGLNQNTNVYDWSEHEEIQQALLNDQKCILHLHGRYRKPQTIIFGADDYSNLISESGYKTVLQQLWMNKHFLFIGCSRDGVLDDDFSTILFFMRQWFPRLPLEHYILMKDDEIRAGSHVKLLKDHNVHAIAFGATHDALPRFINHLNPNEDRLAKYKEHLSLKIETGLKKILDAKTALSSTDVVNQYVKNTLGNPYYWIDSSRLKMLEDALQKYNAAIENKKDQFANYQIIIKGLVSVSELEEKVRLWQVNSDKPATLNNPDFIELGILAYNCLERFPRKMMEDLRHRAPYAIHSYYFENYLGHFIREYKLLKGLKGININSYYKDDKYFFENLKRIIESLRAVLTLDPNTIFTPVEPARPTSELVFPCLLLRSAESISIREIRPPYNSLAFLPGEKNAINRFAEFVVYNGRKIVIGYNSQKCFYWDPERDLTSTEFFEGPLQTAVYRMFNYYDNQRRLVTEVFCGHQIYYFQDFILQKKVELQGNYRHFTRLPRSRRIFCSVDVHGFEKKPCLFEYKGENEFIPILNSPGLFNFIRDNPLIIEMLSAELEEEAHSVPEEDFRFPFIDDFNIAPAKWQDKDVIIARARLSFWRNLVTILMVFDPDKPEWTPESILILPNKPCLAFDLISRKTGVDMVCAYLSYDGNLIEHIPDIDKKPVTIALNVPGVSPRDYDVHPSQDMYGLTVVSADRVLVNEESKYLIDVDFPSMTYTRTRMDIDISSVTYCP
jgi:hypothetical protein